MGDDSTTTTINPTNISEAKFEVDDQRIILNLNSNNNQRQINAATDLGFNLLYYQVEGEQLQYKSLFSICTMRFRKVILKQQNRKR